MRLDIAQYRWILLNCNLVAVHHKGKQHALITPIYPKHNNTLVEILGTNNFPTTEEWHKLSNELRPQMQRSAMERHSHAVRKIQMSPTTELAYLADELKLEILDSLFFDVFGYDMDTIKKNATIINTYKDKIEAMMLNIQLPKRFIQNQMQKKTDYCNQLRLTSDTKRRLSDWEKIDIDEKKLLLDDCIKAFNHAFGCQIELTFFDKNDWEQKRQNFPASLKNIEMPIEYKVQNHIYINLEALEESKDLYMLAVLQQEALFINIKNTDWSCKVIDKLLETKFSPISFDHKEELRVITPIEAHIYGISDEVGVFLRHEMGIKYINGQYNESVNKIVKSNRDKARSIFHYQMYKNNQLYTHNVGIKY